MWNREMVQCKKRLRICNRGGWGRLDYFAHFSQIKMEGFKRLSGKQPVQFEVGADENGREIAVNIVPLTTGEEA